MKKHLSKGFTLIELIVVIAIIAILTLLIIPSLIGYISKSQSTICQTDRSVLERELLEKNIADPAGYPMNEEWYENMLANDYRGKATCPDGGTYTWVYARKDSGYINCSIHGHNDAVTGTSLIGSDSVPGSDTGGGSSTSGSGSSVSVTDSSGAKHTVSATYTDWNQVETLLHSNSGWTIPSGTTFSDGKSVYVYAGYPNNFKDSTGTMTWSSFISKAGLVQINTSAKVYTSTDISTQSGTHWTGSSYPAKGSLYSLNGTMYVAAKNCGQYDTPLNTSGIWIALK